MPKGVIRIRKSKKDRQYNIWPKKKYKRTNNDLQMITQKTKDRATRTSLNTDRELRCPGRVSSSCFTCGTRRVKIFWMTENKKILNHKKCTCLIAWVRRVFVCVSICFCSYRNEVIYMVLVLIHLQPFCVFVIIFFLSKHKSEGAKYFHFTYAFALSPYHVFVL